MRILFVSQFYPPETGGGGIDAYCRQAAIGLKKRGHDVRIISKTLDRRKKTGEVEGIKVYRVPSPFRSHRWGRLPIFGRYVRSVSTVLYAWRVRKKFMDLLPSWAPDIAEYPDINAESLFHPHLCPCIVRLHGSTRCLQQFYSKRETNYSTGAIQLVESRAIKRADGLSAPGDRWRYEVGRVEGIPLDRIECVQNSIDTDFYSPGNDGLSPFSWLVLYVGRLEPLKGAMVFARAIPLVASVFDQAQFAFVGVDRRSVSGGSQKEELADYFQSRELTGKVHFHGHDTMEVFRAYYRKAHVFVMPSFLESFSYTLAEAMACAKPVVVSRAVADLVGYVQHDYNGLVFETGSHNSLADAIILLLQSSEKCREIGLAARRTIVDKFSIPAGAKVMEDFYVRVQSRWRSRAGTSKDRQA